MSESLKPCPFCGGKAMFLTIRNKPLHSDVGVMFKIKCMKCGTELPKSYECEMYMDQDGGIRTGKDERTKATTDWNRRANERLQDMTDDDAEAEGCFDYTSTALGFFDVWDSTIKKSDLNCYGWDANPWVWVIEFERCEKPEGV